MGEAASSDLLAVFGQALLIALTLMGPIIGVTLIIGVVVAVIQAATQIQEPTLSFAPKLIGIAALIVFAGAWMMDPLAALFRFAIDVALRVVAP